MQTIKLGNKTFKVKVAETEEDREQGLMNVKELPQDEGMLFIWDTPQHIDMWMKDTLIPLAPYI